MCYKNLQHASSVTHTIRAPWGSGSKVHNLLQELDFNDDENSEGESSQSAKAHDPAKPWLWEHNLYFNAMDEIPKR